jgi:oligogalacturonide lyase
MYMLNKIRRFTTETSEYAWKASVTRVVPLFALSMMLAASTSAFGQADTTATTPQTQTPPKTWIDADTGHRVTRLTDEPNSEALLPSQNAYTPDGLDMIYASPEAIRALNLATLRTKLIVSGNVHHPIVGTRTRRVFFTRESIDLYAVDIDTRQVKRLAALPPLAVIRSVNADETLLVGTNIEPGARDFTQFLGDAWKEATEETRKNPTANRNSKEIGVDVKQKAMKMRLEAKIPEEIFTVNLQTGEVRTILKGTDWLHKVQFSAMDPDLILYEHNAPYENTEVDRIWTIRADGTQNHMVHQRAFPEESANRQFWSPDGKTIWYEVQRPAPNNPTWADHDMVGYDVATGKRRYYHMDQLQYSVYYGAGNSEGLFCGSGHRSKTVHGDAPTDGQILWSGEWIEVLYPIFNNGDVGTNTQDTKWFHFYNPTSVTGSNVKYTGWFRRERLVNMYNNDYTKFEPEVRFSPDNRYVIFTSNMFGPTYIFAVEVN